jgi:hypothetical protein
MTENTQDAPDRPELADIFGDNTLTERNIADTTRTPSPPVNGTGQETHPLFARPPAQTTPAALGDAPDGMAESPDGISGDVGGGEVYTLEEILLKTKPVSAEWEEWENNLFLLARWVKAVETLTTETWDETELDEKAFGPWYANHPYLNPGQDNRQDLWDAFQEKYEKVTSPLFRQCLDRAWASAEGKLAPAVAMKLKRPEQRQLTLWCQEIARFSADKTFFLSLRSVQSRFGLAHQQIARRRLAELEKEDILGVVTRGSQGPRGKATVYTYLPGIEGE